MKGKPDTGNNVINCICNGLKASGTYEVDGDGRFLVLTSQFGVSRVPLGVMQPRKLAFRLMKNLCTKATADEKSFCGSAEPTRD